METMRDANRIPGILDKLKRLWELHPDLRLGQLVENAKMASNGRHIDTFSVEDDFVEQGLDTLASLFGLPALRRATKRLLTGRDDVFVVDGFFSPEECREYIDRAERIGFSEATVNGPSGAYVNKGMRDNERVILDDFSLASALWARLAEFVPENDDWVANGLNERFRFYRYDAGQQFDWHFDAPWAAHGRQSRLTFMVYLNDGFEGGATELFGETQSPVVVAPKAGTALVFNHNILHRGAPVLSGRKYVVRSDVMTFIRPDPEETTTQVSS